MIFIGTELAYNENASSNDLSCKVITYINMFHSIVKYLNIGQKNSRRLSQYTILAFNMSLSYLIKHFNQIASLTVSVIDIYSTSG